LGLREGLTEINPVAGTGKANEGNGRDRVLTEPELTQLLGGLGTDDFSDIIRLLVLTGQRREEIGGLRWSEVGLDRIVLGPERTKNRRLHELPLSKQAMDILERRRFLRHLNGNRDEWVWGRKFTAWSKSKAILDRRLHGMAPYRLHDLRRTAATHMAELGVFPHIIEAILNHVSGHKSGVAGIYNRARYEGEMRHALQVWGDYVTKLTPEPDK
jgi:integrase